MGAGKGGNITINSDGAVAVLRSSRITAETGAIQFNAPTGAGGTIEIKADSLTVDSVGSEILDRAEIGHYVFRRAWRERQDRSRW